MPLKADLFTPRKDIRGKELVRGPHASRVLIRASRPNHPNDCRRDAESSTRDACAPRTDMNLFFKSYSCEPPLRNLGPVILARDVTDFAAD